MNRTIGLLFAATTLLLTGCGGGGGGGGSIKATGAVAIYFDATTGKAAGPVGTLHQLSVYQSDGTQIDTQTVDLSSGTKQINLGGLPSGTLRLHLGLKSSSSGAEIGAIDTTFDAGTGVPISVAMGQTVASVSVTTPANSLPVGGTAKLLAAARTADGRYVYTATGGWTWSSDTPASATVDASGTATGVAPGTPTFSATQTSSGVSGSTGLSVVSTAVYRGKWTVMVYMDAASSLYGDAIVNMNQMESIASNPNVRFVVQWKQVKDLDGNATPLFSGTRRYLVGYDPTSLTLANNPLKSAVVQDLGSGVDMGAEKTLADFVMWTKSKYPADHYALVLWSHGRGWYTTKALARRPLGVRSISLDDQTGSELSLPDIRTALFGEHLDILAYDACLMQGAESLAEFANRADYIVGNEDDTPEAGFPYHLSFKPFVDTPDAAVPTLASGMATAFASYYQNDPDVTWPMNMSVLDSSKAAGFQTALSGFADALLANPTDLGTLAPGVRSGSTLIEPGEGYSYYDLQQLVTNALAKTGSASVKTAGNALLSSMGSLVVANAQSPLGANLHGVSIEFARSGTFASYSAPYSNLLLSQDGHWDEFLGSATANP